MNRVPVPEPVDIYEDLRSQVLSLSSDGIGVSPTAGRQHVWGILMEMGFPEGLATLVSLADGTVSVYLGSGGGTVGAGTHSNVQLAAEMFLDAAEQAVEALSPCDSFPLPDVGRVAFFVLTFEGPFATVIDEGEPIAGTHSLAPLFAAGNEVLTQIRLMNTGGM